MTRRPGLVLAAFGAAVMAASVAIFGVRAPAHPGGPAFSAQKWPFLLDQWGVGRAFVCAPQACGGRVEVFIRPKIGFCNCATGVADEQELERVADTDLVSPDPRPLGPARPVRIGWMNGLSRSYRVADGSLLSIAYNDACDVVVAVAAVRDTDPGAVEPAVIAFLGSDPMVRWARKELGLESAERAW